MKGSADRWQELLSLSKEQRLVDEGDTIECRCEKGQLPYVVAQVLEACGASFTKYAEDIQIPEDLEVELIHYNDMMDAYRQVAAHTEDYADAVIINRDNVSLNHVLFAWGKPLLDATIDESNPLTLQLFKLALSVFSRPLNINNLLSYLRLPIGPVTRQLRSSLAWTLTTNGGFGDMDWNEIPKEEAKMLRYIWDESIKDGEPIPVATLTDYIDEINKWAHGYANGEYCKDEVIKSQLATVIEYFKQLKSVLGGYDNITYTELEKHVRTIYKPTAIKQAHAQVGALQVVSGYDKMVDVPKRLVWLDCSGADHVTDKYDFLNAAERGWLNEQTGVVIPVLKDMLELNRKEMVTAIAKVKGRVTLVASDYHHNQMLTEHPLVAELKMLRGDKLTVKEGCTDLPRSEEAEVKTMKPKLQYELDGIDYAGRSESNTSIDTLINYPFDYTVQYIARLREPSENELGSIQKTLGLVAHSFIQTLVERVADFNGTERLKKMEEILERDFEEILASAINATGLALLLKENEVKYDNFKDQLKRSIETLISIMKDERLIPVGCELMYEKPLDGVIGDFNARIDMVLEDAEGRLVVFDFKWSYSDFYANKIKEGTALQLELYRQELMAQGKNVKAVGYYLMPKCRLDTPDYATLKDKTGKVIVNHIDKLQDADLFAQIKNSVEQRRKEIENGEIEEGEGQDIKELPYSVARLDGKNMLVVGKEKRRNNNQVVESIIKDSKIVFTTKPEKYFSRLSDNFDDNAQLNETKTTYPLMKGRLK